MELRDSRSAQFGNAEEPGVHLLPSASSALASPWDVCSRAYSPRNAHISGGKTCKPTVAERAINAQDEAAAESPESDQAKGLYRDGMPHQGRDGCIGAQWFNGSYNCLIC